MEKVSSKTGISRRLPTQRRPRGSSFTARRTSWSAVIVVVLTAVCVTVPVISATAVAHADESQYIEWYTPPDPLPPGNPGDLIRTEPSRLVLEPSGQLGAFVGTGTRIMYRSTDAQGKPVAATGTYIEPDWPWPGNGPRPLLAFNTSPYGMGEQCAPSRLFNQGIHASLQTGFDLMINVDEGFIATMLARGYAIVVPDGIGMGVHGPQSPQFLNRIAGGVGLLDAARAAKKLPNTSLDPNGPVAIWGWLGGGHGALSAAELAPSYAPELNVIGTTINDAPTDLAEAMASIDGNFLAGTTGYLLRGIIASYPQLEQAVRDTLTPRGLEMLDNTGRQCLVQTGVDYMFRHFAGWFKDDIYQAVTTDPFKSLLWQQRLGNVKPAGPIYFEHNRWDGFSPYTSAYKTAADYCKMGTDVTFWTNEQPAFFNKLDINAVLAPFVDGERTMAWLADRFNGAPTQSNCADILAP